MAIVNYSAIIFPVPLAMSEGDVIRLNRMYKCGPLHQTQPFQQSISTQPTQAATSVEEKEDTTPDESKPTENEIENSGQKKSKLFGMLIFKDTGEN